MNTRMVLVALAALSAVNAFACTGFVASLLTIADTPFGKFEVTVPEFAARDFSIADFGAKPDGTKCTDAFSAAFSAAENAGGGRVVVPKGTWLTGAISFRSNCNLFLSEGATLEFTDDPADYPEVFTTWEGVECYNHSPLIYAFGVTNVAITGKGTIAPRMDFWRTWFERPPEHMKATEHLYYWCSTNAPLESRRLLALDRAHMRPHLIQFNRCGNVLLDGFRIRESPFWMIHLYHSENCVVRNLDTCAKGHNNDGVDVDMTKNVLVENCRFDQGDDGVVLKAGRNADAWRIGRCTENVVVRDCDLVNCHSLLGIGSELSGGVRNVWMTRCTVEDTYSMLRIKTGPRRGGFVENVFMDHCRGRRMIRVFNIFTSYSAQWGLFPDFELRRTKIRNVSVSDCEAAIASVGVELRGDRLMPPSGIRVRNVRIGRVVNSLSDIRNCLDVELAGLSLLPRGEMPVGVRPRLFFAGDSTLDDHGKSFGGTYRDPYRSWGTTLQKYMAAGCTVRNYAKSGDSTKSFIKSGLWRTMIRDVKPGDYVAIQFGHNDQKRSSDYYLKERWCDPKGLFCDNVRSMVKQVRGMGATPILLSPICRGTFDNDGKRLVDTTHASDGVCLGSYRDAMKELSVELDCDYVDMNGLTRELMERVGRDEAMKFFVISTGLVFGKDGEPSKDVTHPVQAGAEAFAKLFLDDVRRRELPVVEMFGDAPAAPEMTWSIMHPTAIDTNYMARVVAKAEEYGGVDSLEICGLEQKGINALSTFDRYPHASANVDRAFVEKTRRDLGAACEFAHRAGKKVYFWHRENLVPKGIFEDVPEMLDDDGELDLLGKPYADYMRAKIGDALDACPGLDGLVLTLTESEYSVIHNSNQARYPAVKVVESLVGVFAEELRKRGKRFILRSFGVGEDYAKIIAGATAAVRQNCAEGFEIETKVTEADFVPWLPINKYLKRNPPLSLGAECDALGEFLGAGALPAAQVAKIREYVDNARDEGVSRYAIRIDRGGTSVFDTAHEVNLCAYTRFVRDPSATADGVLSEYAERRFGAAAVEMVPVLKGELDMVRDICYVASNLMFHAPPKPYNFNIAKAGGVFALFREGEPLSEMKPVWSILHWMRAPSHAQIMAEKDRAVAMAEDGLAKVGRLAPLMPPEESARQCGAFSNAVALARAMRGFTRCAVAYFEDMADKADDPRRLAAAVVDARSEIARIAKSSPDGLHLDGISAYCGELLEEYRVERSMRRRMESRRDVVDFVVPGGIFDDGRVSRVMHAAYSERKGDRLVRHVGNLRYPNGRITVRLKGPQSARIEVALDPDGPQWADVAKEWADGVWTVSIGKKGKGFPSVMSISALASMPLPVDGGSL